jgi:murein L,D-transpeptidase YcbB/YkuD
MNRPVVRLRVLFGLMLVTSLALGCGDDPTGEVSPVIQEVVGTNASPVVQFGDAGDTIALSKEVAEFYRDRGFHPAWTDYDEVLDRGQSLLATMGRSEQDGLDPERYRFSVATRMLRMVDRDSLEESEEPHQMGVFDMVLSEVFARYANHLAGGTVDPKASGLEWTIPTDVPNTKELLTKLADGTEPDGLVETMRPKAPEYRRMSQAVDQYQKIKQAGGWQGVTTAGSVKAGGSSESIGALRRRLIAEGNPKEKPLAEAGNAQPDVLDKNLQAALKHFQQRHGLEQTGKLDDETLKELNTTVDERLLQLGLNMDRWRWLPRELGDLYVLVNVAGFELEVVENDSAIMNMNVVVGQEGWETAIFRDTIESVVVNPYWNVPNSIIKEEILPAIAADPTYLERKNFERVGNGGFRQKPGPGNALGEVKIIFPNEHDIYLHDTPAGALFAESSRAFSHGCIRLERPVDLAKLLMAKATNVSPNKYEELRARMTEQHVRLTKPVPVYILYFTAWADRDGGVRFHRDIYDIDKSLRQEAQKQLGRVASN